MNFAVYILFSELHNRYYIGHTADLDLRINRHNKGYEISTKPFIPWKLIWSCEKTNRGQAMILERKLKNLNRDRLLKFIRKYSCHN